MKLIVHSAMPSEVDPGHVPMLQKGLQGENISIDSRKPQSRTLSGAIFAYVYVADAPF